MSVLRYFGTVATPGTGAGTQVISGIADPDAGAFTPKVVIFFGVGGGAPSDYSYVVTGVDDGSTCWGAVSAADYKSRTGTAYRTSFNTRSFSLVYTDVGLAAGISRKAKITAIASGQFTLTYTLDAYAESFYFLALGGTDLTYAIGHLSYANAPVTVTGLTFTPTAIVAWRGGNDSVSGTGFNAPSVGWATSAAQQGVAAINERGYVNPSETQSYQRTSLLASVFNVAGSGLTASLGLTAFTSDGFTLSCTSSVNAELEYLVLGGVEAYAGSVTQGLGQQVLPTPGIVPLALLTLSDGMDAATTIQANASLSMGGTDGTRQASVWTGNSNGLDPDNPGRYNNATSCVTYFTPTTHGTGSVVAQAALTSFGSGRAVINWTTTDSGTRELLYLAIGTAVTPTPAAVTRYMRRVRRFPLPFDQHFLIFLQRIEFLVQSGVGLSTGQGSDPVIMMRLSRDGGHTFGNEIWLTLGKMGEYLSRAYAYQLGSGRNLVCEIVDTDPVFSALLACYVDVEKGTS